VAKVLVTGARGFIGSHVVRALLGNGHEVVGLDNDFTASHEMAEIKTQRVDVTSYDQVLDAARDCDVIVHLAGLLGTHEIAELGQINLANSVNIGGTVNVLEACRITGADLVFATKPNPRDWLNPYTITKQAAEDYCEMYANEYGVNTIALSLFWVYGPGQRQEPVNKFIPTFFRNALEGKPIPIWNTGHQVIDCCYVADIAEAFARAVGLAQLSNKGYTRVDIGTGVPVTVLDVANEVIAQTGSKTWTTFLGKRHGEPNDSYIIADTVPCEEYLGFIPGIHLEEGVSLCLPHYKEKYG